MRFIRPLQDFREELKEPHYVSIKVQIFDRS